MSSTRQISHFSLDDLISHFKLALTNRSADVIKAMWDGNPLLRAWYSGQPVDFGDPLSGQLDIWTISFEDLIADFKWALTTRGAGVVTKAIWNGNPLLRAWYSGQPVDFGYCPSGQPDTRVISLDDLISHFKSALTSRSVDVIKAMWNGNPLLRAWYSGQPVDFGDPLSGQSDIRTISFDDLISHFKSMLASQRKKFIKAMWDGNSLLRDWYSGKQVNFGDRPSGQPDMRTISLNDLISHFKSALASQYKELIEAMWDGNQRLHNAIQSLDINQSKLLLKKVMSSCSDGKTDFISQYLSWLDDAGIIRMVLAEIQASCGNKQPSIYKARQIRLLRDRLNEMPDVSQRHRVTMIAPPHSSITVSDSHQLTTSIQHVPARKRKILSKVTKPSRSKKQRIEMISELALSNLVKKMPPLFNGQTSFCVEQDVGLDLKKIPKAIKEELGIGFIGKVRNKANYKVEISDPSAYRHVWGKYNQLFVTSPYSNYSSDDQNSSTGFQYFHQQAEQRSHLEDGLLTNGAAAESIHLTTEVLPDIKESNFDVTQNLFACSELSSQNNADNSQQSVERLSKENWFTFEYDLMNDIINPMGLFNPSTESNTASTTTSQPSITINRTQTTSSFTLFGHQFNTQTAEPVVSGHTDTSKEYELWNLDSHNDELEDWSGPSSPTGFF
ncbi:MAG: hypothetical protein KIT56_01195 [Gammaproteobacteria bacterium]|nr:hypothetical protein [Gammaproteobacteria bacterium]MCW5582500.1 hypothetical protein [Gammaproteobacteria bacterium]